jgi:hypothetical protein
MARLLLVPPPADYRRVTVEVDARHVIMRKFLERCGFKLEAVLRKHRVVDRRNSDAALYVLLNSEWTEADQGLKKLLGLPLREQLHKVAEIDTTVAAVGAGNKAKGGKGSPKKKKQ